MPYFPNIRGLVNSRVEQEIYRAFKAVYEYFDTQLKDIETRTTNTATANVRQQLNLFAANLAAPIIDPTGNQLATAGQDTTLTPADIPNLDTSKITTGTFSLSRIPSNIVKTDDAFTITPGVIPVAGKITIKDNAGHSVDVLVA